MAGINWIATNDLLVVYREPHAWVKRQGTFQYIKGWWRGILRTAVISFRWNGQNSHEVADTSIKIQDTQHEKTSSRNDESKIE